MKEVIYDGNLNDDIDTLNRNYNTKKEFILKFGLNVIFFSIAEIIAIKCGIIATPETLLPLFGVVTSVSCIDPGISVFVNNKKYKKELKKAKHNVSHLCSELAKENTIIEKEALEDCEVIEKITKSSTRSDDYSSLSKIEKVVDYFYLLDSNDQIAVLRQIKETIKHQKSTSTNTRLELLEEDDLKDKELPVRKTLIRKEF